MMRDEAQVQLTNTWDARERAEVDGMCPALRGRSDIAVGGSWRKTDISNDCRSDLGFLGPMLERTLETGP